MVFSMGNHNFYIYIFTHFLSCSKYSHNLSSVSHSQALFLPFSSYFSPAFYDSNRGKSFVAGLKTFSPKVLGNIFAISWRPVAASVSQYPSAPAPPLFATPSVCLPLYLPVCLFVCLSVCLLPLSASFSSNFSATSCLAIILCCLRLRTVGARVLISITTSKLGILCGK